MDYSIADSQLKQIIDTFITDQVGTLTKHTYERPIVNYYWWTDKHDVDIFEVDDESMGVYDGIWLLVKEFFNLTDDETNDSFLRWAYHHMGMEFDGYVCTFGGNWD